MIGVIERTCAERGVADRRRRSRARRGFAAVAALLALAGCTDSTGTAASDVSPQRPSTTDTGPAEPTTTDASGGEIPIVEPDPPIEGGDGLERLPMAESTASMLVSNFPVDEVTGEPLDLQLRWLDLDTGTFDDIADLAEGGGVGFADDGDALWVTNGRSIGRRDATTGERTTIELPADLGGAPGTNVGSIGWLDGVAGYVTVTVGGLDDESRQTAMFDAAGSAHCTGPKGTGLTNRWLGQLWTDDARTRLDPVSCELSDGLQIPPGSSVSNFVIERDAYVMANERDADAPAGSSSRTTVRRFDVETGQQLSSSAPVDVLRYDVVVHGDEVWVIAGTKVLRLDARTLEQLGTAEVPNEFPECEGTQYLQPQGSDVYLVDDCSGILYLLDPSTALPVKGWGFPYDDGSDTEIHATSTDEGIWIINAEQTAEPYLFDTEEQRFERLPFPDSVTSTLFALDFAVYPMPGD